jgi:hypothetical protein
MDPPAGAPAKANRAARRRPRPGGKPNSRKTAARGKGTGGRLRIGDNWNAITIIALSQNNPLKAIAEFVENSIDAHARNITIVRGKDQGQLFLKVIDDGEGLPRDPNGAPDFRYVATHICDSAKRRLKEEGIQGIQGEFGIGLLSFWTVGERLTLASAGADGRTYQMEMAKGEPGYSVHIRKTLFSHPGAELKIHPLLSGLRQLTGEKIQSYLASELRDRIRKAEVRVRILDRTAKKDLEVQPRQFTGRLLHDLGVIPTALGEVYLELYLNSPSPDNRVGLYRAGTRVLASLTELDALSAEPWSSGYLQGMVEASFLQLTPGTRGGVVHDHSFQVFSDALETVRLRLLEIIKQEKQAGEEAASRNILRAVRKAFKEALLALASAEYNWFEVPTSRRPAAGAAGQAPPKKTDEGAPEPAGADGSQARVQVPGQAGGSASAEVASDRAFFEYPGPLYQAVISPASAVMKVGAELGFRCIPRDKRRRTIEEGVAVGWSIREGEGQLSALTGEIVAFRAPAEPGLTILQVRAEQGQISCTAESRVTITETLLEKEPEEGSGRGRGLPGYTFRRAPGELWRSRFDEKDNLIVINNGHRDYVFAAQKPARKLKYICRLYAKELVLANFPGFEAPELIERVIELSLYTEEHLRYGS